MNLQLEILSVLRECDGHLVLRSTLVASLRLRDRKESLAEIDAAIRTLESRDEVVGTTNRDTGSKWKITDEGKVRLAEANL